MKFHSSCSCILFSFSVYSFFGKNHIDLHSSDGTFAFLLGIIFIACASPHFQKVSNFILGGKNLRTISEHTAVHWCVCSGNFLHLLKIITSFQLLYLANNNLKQLMFSIMNIIRVQSITYLGRISLDDRKQENHKTSHRQCFSEKLITSNSYINDKIIWAMAVYIIMLTSKRSYKRYTLWIVLFMQ